MIPCSTVDGLEKTPKIGWELIKLIRLNIE